MSDIVITIRIAVPEDATVRVGEDAADQEAPLPWPVGTPVKSQQSAPQQQFVPQQVIAPQQANPVCPVHGGSRFVPAGTSKNSGKSYNAFWACSSPKEVGCSWKA